MAFKIVMGRVKGGVASSTTASNLAVYFAHRGHRVVVLDCDVNQSVSGFAENRSAELPQFEVIDMQDTKRIARVTQKLDGEYDIIIIDGSPALDEKATYLILLADLIVIPTPADMFSISAQEIFIERYLEARAMKDDVAPAYFLMSMYNPRINLHKEFKETLKAYDEYQIGTLKSYTEYRTAYRTSLIKGQGVYEWTDPKAKQEIKALGDELIKIGKVFQVA